jgi:hypothetical protein
MRRTFLVAIMAIAVVGMACIATAATPELRPFAGALVPTGDQRDVLDDMFLMGIEGGVELADAFHLVGTFGWAPSKYSEDPSLFQYDVGVETFRAFPMTPDWEIRPFLGAGLGARTYVQSGHQETNFAGYGALGAEFQLDRVAIRLEARDYMTRFKGIRGDEPADTRNDLAILGALAVHLW